MPMTDKVINHWIQKLSKFHWSPDHPETYLVKHLKTGDMVGIGRVAMQSPGSFNLAWAYSGSCIASYAKHVMVVAFFAKAAVINKYVIDGAELEEWLTVYNRTEYTNWYKTIYSRLPESIKTLHNSALNIHEVPKL